MSATDRLEDEDALPIEEQTNRPMDTALQQQRIQAWHPILHPVWVIVSLFYLGIILVPVGYTIDSMQDDIVELRKTYDDYNVPQEELLCGIGEEFNAGKLCEISFTPDQDMHPPILIYYELTNFHQNHRSYVQSRDNFQLNGRVGGQEKVDRERCEPLNTLGNMTINPCGLIANTFFNDIFRLSDGVDENGVQLKMIEDGIAWQSDIDYRFSQPDGFRFEECPSACDETCCEGEEWSCKEPFEDETGCYRFFYPNQDTTRYLWETYPDIISPLEGVTNEHFIVWMRVALQPTFRKLYGWIDQTISAGTTITFQVKANYVVTRFRGSKSLIVTTNNIFGGRNIYLGPIFIWVGFFCLGAGAFFTLKHTFRPRRLADKAYLHFKAE